MRNIFAALFVITMLVAVPLVASAYDANGMANWSIEKAMQFGQVTSPALGGGGHYIAASQALTLQQKEERAGATSFAGLYVPR